ncbi:hypothetical protein [Hoyosella sp. YIM 151337]|uniref:hypothetical protein n=1 Tax=Hoyosella sp. YIM 151337 TaxID=2992742 RepID=UPI0027E0C447|nr:hypothetical protein [Hoyosella sp. YIM 151337]
MEAPDGAIWQLVSSSRKNTAPAAKQFDSIVLLLGVAYLPAAKRFYIDHEFEVARSFGGRYAEFVSAPGDMGLALHPRKSLAKVAGVRDFGDGSHRLVITAKEGTFTDPDGFVWESNPAA